MAPGRGASTLAPVADFPWPSLIRGLLASLLAPLVLMSAGGTGAAALTGPLVYLAGAGLVAWHWPGRSLGPANQITLVRLVGVSWVAATLPQAVLGPWSPATHLFVIGVGTLSLLLDGVDGRVARAWGGASPFGARFDMETDAALVLVLSLAVGLLDVVGGWALAVGLMRYAYLACSYRWPWLRAPLPESTARKAVGVAQGVALLAALLCPLVPGLPPAAPDVVVAPALVALCWSFGRDARWQRARHLATVR
ncbi:CDP-alcohol phosphatidyltransferase family protein [Georgenia sp. SYP-B2076]|uniref:CDP-alcohol phosphatidyltransferase family protein n=1 Tax=Georgenia sp. SYP-B2076 TaxID=2495881 RepID=UPI000F8D7A54|nr:CDP-alcohol phosphatidyltransferase family protein [Georgenia sp. SYP-B2076]